MRVSCPSCSAQFNIPDEKIAGKRARMACKKCGTPIPIDGRSLTVRGGDVAPPNPSPGPQLWRVAEPGGRRHELTLAEVQKRLSAGQFEEATSFASPGSPNWLAADEHDALALHQPARDKQVSFSDETVALGAEEARALAQQAQGASLPKSATPPLASPPKANSFFDSGDVDDAMDMFESALGYSTAPGGQAPPQPSEVQAFDDEDAKTRVIDGPNAFDAATTTIDPVLAAVPSVPPAQASSYPPPPRPSSQPAGMSGASSRPPPAYPHPPTPSAPPISSAPSPFARTPSPNSDVTVPPSSGPVVPARPFQDAPVLDAPDAPLVPLPVPTAPLGGEPPPRESHTGTKTLPDDGRMEELRASMQPAKRSRWGLVLFIIAVVVVGSGVGLYFLRPALFEQGVNRLRGLIGQAEAPRPTKAGPPFDTLRAGELLEQAARRAERCKAKEGPSGRGRASVLYDPSGKVTSAAVSSPFNKTSVGDCLVALFSESRVPEFGGVPVRVDKTFELN